MKKKSNLVKILLTIPALGIGILNAIKLLLYLIGNCILFLLRITGIMFILRPVVILWSKDPVPPPIPVDPNDLQENHEFH